MIKACTILAFAAIVEANIRCDPHHHGDVMTIYLEKMQKSGHMLLESTGVSLNADDSLRFAIKSEPWVSIDEAAINGAFDVCHEYGASEI